MPTALTSLSPADRSRAVTAEFSRVAGAVTDWDAQTPVPEWKARDVCAHFTEGVPGFFAGAGVTLEAPAPTGDPAAAGGVCAGGVGGGGG